MSEEFPTGGSKFNGVWLVAGVGLGVWLGVVLKNPALGLSPGVVIGVSLGFSIPRKKS